MSHAATKSVAMQVLRRLRSAGHVAYFAGGCVRDMLLGVPCHDYDIATDAAPVQVRKLFRHVLLVGAQFGVAMVIVNRRKVEVTTFRSDLSYRDGRRPEGVRFSSPQEDARRRDFTINGMFYDPITEEVIDYVGGKADLAAKVIRAIGEPDQRFSEDYLRLIRAVRFAVRLGFTIEPQTAAAIQRRAEKIAAISGERIFEELSKMLAIGSAGEALRRLEAFGLARVILPELFAAPDLWSAAVERVEQVAPKKDVVLALAALLCEVPAQDISRRLRHWGASNDLCDGLCWLAQHRDEWREAADMPLHQFKRLLANPHFKRLQRLWRLREEAAEGTRMLSRRIAARARAILPGRIAPPPLVTGADLKALGMREGARLGMILRALYDAQLDERLLDKAQALQEARQLIQNDKT